VFGKREKLKKTLQHLDTEIRVNSEGLKKKNVTCSGAGAVGKSSWTVGKHKKDEGQERRRTTEKDRRNTEHRTLYLDFC